MCCLYFGDPEADVNVDVDADANAVDAKVIADVCIFAGVDDVAAAIIDDVAFCVDLSPYSDIGIRAVDYSKS